MKFATRVRCRTMLDWLRTCAETNEPCPSNDQIAARFQFASSASSAALLKGMEEAGLISVERFHSARVVTIVELNMSTLRPANAKPHWRARVAKSFPEPERKPLLAKPRISAAVIRAAKLDGRDLPTFVTALIDMGLECWRDDRAAHNEVAA